MTRVDAVFALDQYEALRRQALGAPSGRGHGLGMALLLARGMVAWLTAVRDYDLASATN